MPFGVAAAAVGAIGANVAANRAARASREAADIQSDAQLEALNYQREVEAPVLDIRNQALPLLSSYFGIGGEGGQQEFIDLVRSSPFYQTNLEQSEEAIRRNASATGGLRSGATNEALSLANTRALESAVNQRLGGLSQLAFPGLNTNAIAQNISNIGQTNAQGLVSAESARQAGFGQGLNAITQGLRGFI